MTSNAQRKKLVITYLFTHIEASRSQMEMSDKEFQTIALVVGSGFLDGMVSTLSSIYKDEMSVCLLVRSVFKDMPESLTALRSALEEALPSTRDYVESRQTSTISTHSNIDAALGITTLFIDICKSDSQHIGKAFNLNHPKRIAYEFALLMGLTLTVALDRPYEEVSDLIRSVVIALEMRLYADWPKRNELMSLLRSYLDEYCLG